VASPQDIGLGYESVWLTAGDGVRLHGWYLPADDGRAADGAHAANGQHATLLFLHGNAGNISHRLDSLRIFHRLGLSVLIFDYRGYGQSEGSPSEEGLERDARAAWEHLTRVRGVAPESIVVFGRSMGAALAAGLAAEQRPAALIIESAFTSVPDLAAQHYWWVPARSLARLRFDTREALARVRAPVLVVHSEDDEIVPFAHGEALYAAAREPKSLLRLRGDHNGGFMLSGDDYVHGLSQFLDAHGGRQPRSMSVATW
jgi:fermentation-respiration switch protein FrsA (DUF1100 family)